jgi:glycosyltransferase involved in cell wall biosynthesis
MKVLVVCPTYGRLHYLGRVLAGFLSQTHHEKEIVFINDNKNVTIQCNYSNVHCINLDKKILLPDKRNLGVAFGSYDLYMPHDDDDIFLPDRISNRVKVHTSEGVTSTVDATGYIIYNNKFSKAKNVGATFCSYTRKAFYQIGGYQHHQNSGEDQEFYYKLCMDPGHKRLESVYDAVYNFYHNNGSYHTSYAKQKDIDEIAYKQLVDVDLLDKVFTIVPDYTEYIKFVDLARRFNNANESIAIKVDNEGKIVV